PVDLFSSSRSRHELRARPDGHSSLLQAIPAADGALEVAVRCRYSRLRLRRVRARAAAGGRETARLLRTRVGGALPVVSGRTQCGQDGERVAGAAAPLSTLFGPLAELRAASRFTSGVPRRFSR